MSVQGNKSSSLIGQTIDTYEIESILGKGGMGAVYKARDQVLRNYVALKMMASHLAENDEFVRRFKSEGIAMARLQHPNIVSVKTLRQTDHYLFLVMEYVSGGTLGDLIKKHKGVPWQQSLAILIQALSALQYAHNHHIIHRDIKPNNILLTEDQQVKVTDFGLAKIQEMSSDSYVATRTGFRAGTIYYMPPEQLEGLSKVDHRSDIYSMGMTFFEVLAGRPPFDKKSSEFKVLKAIDEHNFPSLDELNPDLPKDLVDIIMRSVEREAEDRYQQAAHMIVDLKKFATQQQVETPFAYTRPKQGPGSTQVNVTEVRGVTLANGAEAAAPAEEKSAAQKENTQSSDVSEGAPKAASGVSSGAAQTPSAAPGQGTVVESDSDVDALFPEQSGELPKESRMSRASSDSGASGVPSMTEEKPGKGKYVVVLLAIVVLAALGYGWQAGWFGGETPSVVSLQTAPPGATVALDGTLLGTAPLNLNLTRGRHTLHIEHPDYLALDTVITIRAATASYYFALRRAPVAGVASGRIVFESNPAGADIFLGGRRIGRTPHTESDLAADLYQVQLRRDGYEPYATTISLGAGETNTMTAALTPVTPDDGGVITPPPVTPDDTQATLQGGLVVQSDPVGASVYLNDELVGITPYRNLAIDVGAYTIRVSEDGYAERTQQASVVEGDIAVIDVPLEALMGTLSVIVRPFGDVYINDELVGTAEAAPLRRSVAVGPVRVRAMHPTLGEWEKRITIGANQTQTIRFDFTNEYRITVTSEPTAAEILVDGQPIDLYTPSQVSLPPGSHTISVRKDGHTLIDGPISITLEADRSDRFHFRMQANN